MSKLTQSEAMEIVNKLQDKTTWTRFDTKQAYIGVVQMHGELPYQLFKSYSTIVALVDLSDGVIYRLGKWSPTTSKQTTQFANRYYPDFEQI